MLEVSGICKSYKKNKVLTGVSFHAEPGDCIGIVGGNGCGKTTLLSILAGVLRADAGSVRYEGEEILGNVKKCGKYMAYVPQENPLMEELSVRDNLRLWYQGDKKAMEEDLEHGVCAMLGIPAMLSMTAGKLSGGMKKRLSIAMALSNRGKVLILDEPGAALDIECKEDIRQYLGEHISQGGIVLLASHELEELSVCNRMYLLKNGTLKEISTGLSGRELVEKFR